MKFAIRPIPFPIFCMIAFALLFTALQAHAQGGCTTSGPGNCPPVPAPEIDPSLASAGLALITGAVLLVRGRRHKQ